MRLEQLEYLLEISKTGSIFGAAASLSISQPAISKAIRDLEVELGCPLLIRARHGSYLTAYGEKVVLHAKDIMGATDKIKNIKLGDATLNSRINIVSSVTSSIVISRSMEAFRRRYPKVEIFHSITTNFQAIEAVLHNQADIGIMELWPQPISFEDLDIEYVSKVRMVLCAGKELAKQFSDPVEISDLSEYPFLSTSYSYDTLGPLTQWARTQYGLQNLRYVSPLSTAVLDMVVCNQGIAFLTALSVKNYPQNRELIWTQEVPKDTPTPTLCIIKRRSYTEPSEVTALLAIIRKRAKTLCNVR